MNYRIIRNKDVLLDFIEWLPDLLEGECFYVALFARKKYHESAKNDKSQCKRFTATSKEWLYKKLLQLEIPIGAYTNKDGSPVHQDALAVYVTVNPRSFMKAQILLLKKLVDTIPGNLINMNPKSMAMSALQKAKSRTVYVDFDFDGVDFSEYENTINAIVDIDAYEVLCTRGGFHLLVDPMKVRTRLRKTWYRTISSLHGCDVSGDVIIPIAGCCQGGFTPWLFKRNI